MYICKVKNNYSPKYINMKKIFTFFVATMLVGAAFAQPADWSKAKDFTVYEIDKTTGTMINNQAINLYSMLNDYKTVFIDVSATTCGPCYSLHKAGVLESLANNYGPNSSVNDSRVLFIESAPWSCSSWSQLNGSASGTWDCIHAYGTSNPVPYPVVPMGFEPNYSGSYQSFDNDFNISSFPTFFMVCPSRHVHKCARTGSDNSAALHSLISSKCPDVTQANNAAIFVTNTIPFANYCGFSYTPSFMVENTGTNNMTSMTYRLTKPDGTHEDFTWTGNLPQFGTTENITFPTISGTVGGAFSYNISVVNVNGTDLTPIEMHNSFTEDFAVYNESTIGTLTQNFNTSSWPEGWIAQNCELIGNAIGFRAYDLPSGTVGTVCVPALNFTNNAHPSLQFSYAHKRYSTSYSEKLQVKISTNCGQSWTTLFSKSGSSLATVSGTTNAEYTASESDYKTVAFDLSQYAGMDKVYIQFVFTSAYGNDVYVDNVIVADHDLTNIENVELNSELSMYPNPATDVVNIAYDKAIDQVEIYDVNGKLVKSYGHVENTISVSGLATGNYMVKMYTEDGIITKTLVKE